MAWSVLEQIENHVGLLKVSDLARILGKHRQTIYEMLADGRIPRFDDGTDNKVVDPKTYAYVLRKRNPITREAARHS